MQSVLLIMNSFAPTNTCGSIPNTKLAKYLAREDVEITLITDEVPINRSVDEKLIPAEISKMKVYRVGQTKIYNATLGNTGKKMKDSGVTLKMKSEVRPLRSKLVSALKSIYFRAQEYDWLLSVKIHIWNKIKKEHFDVVYSTYPGVQAHLLARAIMRTKVADKWIADFRDPMCYVEYDSRRFKKAMRTQHRIEREADYITVVSEGAMEKFLPENKTKGKIAYIPNGYDPEDFQLDASSTRNTEYVLRFFYAGSLYAGRRDLTVMFRALSQLAEEGSINLENIRVEYAGNEWPILLSYAERYQLGNICENYGYIPRHRVMEILSDVDCSIVCSHNTAADQGVVTGKVFELLLVEKPILAVITGDTPNSELGSIIRDCNAGFVYEQARDDTDYNAMKQWLNNCYHEKMTYGKVRSDLDRSAREQYSYDHIASRLFKIVKSL